jgi:shikimate dehydrogenase
MSVQLTVFGHPIEHSLSPAIHRGFAKQFGIDLSYTTTDVEPGSFEQVIEQFHRSGGVGANVTVPFKGEAFACCTHLSDSAKRAKAVNTLFWNNDGLYGTNTDGPGLVQDITLNIGQTITDKRVLILGAGGAAWGIIGPLLDASPKNIVVASRTFAKAQDISEAFDNKILPLSFEDLAHVDAQFDLVINATSASLSGDSLNIPVSIIENSFAYDLMYHPSRQTPFTQWASYHGAQGVSDGLGMLIEQAALGFNLWFGKQPETKPIFKMIG